MLFLFIVNGTKPHKNNNKSLMPGNIKNREKMKLSTTTVGVNKEHQFCIIKIESNCTCFVFCFVGGGYLFTVW